MKNFRNFYMCLAFGLLAAVGTGCTENDSASENKSPSDENACVPECTDGKVCIEGECKAQEKKCDPACKDGEVCVAGECKPSEEKTCDPACTDGKVCVAGECKDPEEPGGDECDPACTDGKVCVAGECKDSEGDECDPACTDGKVCVAGECKDPEGDECEPACTDGKVCVAGECKDPEGDECEPACTDGKVCVAGECKDPEGDKCEPACTDGKVCVAGECKDPEGDECDPACTDDMVCVAGKCEAPEDPDEKPCEPACKDGKVCVEGECVASEEPVVAKVLVTPLEGLVTVQNRVDASFTVSLNSAPKDKVVLPLKTTNKEAGTLSASQIDFTSDNWDKPQTIKVTGAKAVMPDDETVYQIVVGPSESKDTNYDKLPEIKIQVKHYNQMNTLKLDKKEASLLLRKVKKTSEHGVNSVTFTVMIPEAAADKDVKWNIVNADKSDKTDLKKLISYTSKNDEKAGTSTVTITRLDIDLTGEETKKSKLDLARTLIVTASTKDSTSEEAKLELKPYLPLGFNYGYYTSHVKDFSFKAEKDDLSCKYYDVHSTQVFDEDMYRYYVEPKMAKNDKGELVATRASVVAAARFLVLQFPKDIPYSGTHKCVYDKDKKLVCKRGETTFASYTWTASKLGTGENYKDKQLFGLSLSPNGYNNLTSFGSPIKKDIGSWGCSFKEYFGGGTIYKKDGKTEVKHPNIGLCCSAFVSWALRNGMFDVGLLYTTVFAMQYDSKTKKNTKRVFMDKTTLYKRIDSINKSIPDIYDKLKGIKETDIIPLSKVDKANTPGIKAGDLLYYSGKCTCSDNQKCPSECDCSSGGHLAMILGIYYKTVNGKKEISTIYVAEAGGAGNRLTYWKIDEAPKFAEWNCSGGKCHKADSCKEVKLIKMGNAYNYYIPDGDTKNYTDTWW